MLHKKSEKEEKELFDFLTDSILTFKIIHNKLPDGLTLAEEFIPESCKENMVLRIDDVDIPIYEEGKKPC